MHSRTEQTPDLHSNHGWHMAQSSSRPPYSFQTFSGLGPTDLQRFEVKALMCLGEMEGILLTCQLVSLVRALGVARGMGDKGWMVSSFKRPNTLTCVAAVCLPRSRWTPAFLCHCQKRSPLSREAPLSFSLPHCTWRKDRQQCCRPSDSFLSLSAGVWL